jgi:ribonuclease I
MASAYPELLPLVSVLDRHVRNALTHGPPMIERAAQRCQFWDHDTCVTWSWDEYFRNTRALTLTVLGCANLESFRQLIEVQLLVRFLSPIN